MLLSPNSGIQIKATKWGRAVVIFFDRTVRAQQVVNLWNIKWPEVRKKTLNETFFRSLSRFVAGFDYSLSRQVFKAEMVLENIPI